MALVVCFLLSACKKDYVCKCSDIGVPDMTFKIHDTEKNAKKQCSQRMYYTGACELQ